MNINIKKEYSNPKINTIWGLGIEHEMRIRFKTPVNELSDDYKKNFDNKDQNKYIFADSMTLLYYFYLYEIIIMEKSNKYMKTPEEKIYYENLRPKLELFTMAKKKTPFPLYNKRYFNLYGDEKKLQSSVEYFNFYLFFYTLYHAPLLFFRFHIVNEKLDIGLEVLSKMNEVLRNEPNKESVKIYLEEELKKLYTNQTEYLAYDYIKKLIKKVDIVDIQCITEITPTIDKTITYLDLPKIIVHTNNSNNYKKIYHDDFINKINNYILVFKEIFNFDNINKMSLINDYSFYKNLFVLYQNKIPEYDYSNTTEAIEFKTVEYKNKSYELILEDLIQLEKTFFWVINNIPVINKITKIYGELMYHNIGSIDKTIIIYDFIQLHYRNNNNEDYSGSYHIWLTSPYNNKVSNKKFLEIHATLANKLQLLEPLLSSHYSSPSYNTVINSNKYSKSSLRQFINQYCNYGTTDISLIQGGKKHDIIYYYLSEDDIIKNNKFFVQKYYYDEVYDIKGNLIINYNKLQNRDITSNLYKKIDIGNIESKNTKIYNYISMIFDKTNIRSKMFITEPRQNRNANNRNTNKFYSLGADIRTKDMSDLFYPLDKKWSKKYLMKNNKLIEVYYNNKTKQISYERIYDQKEYNNKLENERMGIEFRILDHFPTSYLNQVLSLLVPIVMDSAKYPKKITSDNMYTTKQFWHNEIYEVIKNGYKYIPSKKYIEELEKEFKIKLNSRALPTEDIIELIHNNLHLKWKTSRNKVYKEIKFKKNISFFNFNKKAWFEIIHKLFEIYPQKMYKILNIKNKSELTDNIIKIMGNQHNFDIYFIKNYISEYNK
jgi:hypothetical protein